MYINDDKLLSTHDINRVLTDMGMVKTRVFNILRYISEFVLNTGMVSIDTDNKFSVDDVKHALTHLNMSEGETTKILNSLYNIAVSKAGFKNSFNNISFDFLGKWHW